MPFFPNTESRDVILGTADADEFSFNHLTGSGAGDDSFAGRGGNDYALGGLGRDSLSGGEGDDTLYGNAGNDVLLGGDGNDFIDAGTGGGSCDGGSGNDTIMVTASFGEAKGGNGKDTLDFSQSLVAIAINMADGGYMGNEALGFENIGGTAENDQITGDDGNNRLSGHSGNDTLDGGGGNDVLEGNSGIFANFDIDDLNGRLGNDKLYGQDGSDTLDGGQGDDYLHTGGPSDAEGDDTALGGAGDDTLVTADGNDLLDGGAGKDTAHIIPTFKNIVIDLQTAGPFEIGADWEVTLVKVENITIDASSIRADLLSGNNAANRFDAGQGDDQLNGRGGNDTLLGRTGNDTLNGGAGADVISGHEDSDTFIYLASADSNAVARDRITDFVPGTDKLNFASFVDGLGAAVDFTFIGGNAFSGAGELRFEAGVLSGDSDGDSIADFEVALTGVAALQAGDFVL